MKLPPHIKPWVKLAALVIGMAADGIMLFICFTSQALDDPSKVAFGALGIMLILLIPLALEERAFKLWLAMMFLAVYFDTSYLLLSTDDTKRVVVKSDTDQELQRLTNAGTQATEASTKAQDAYAKALADPTVTRATMADLNQQVTAKAAEATAAEAARKQRFDDLEAGRIRVLKLKPDDLFLAIPDAIARGRIMQLISYGMLACIIQAMIAFALREPGGKRGRLSRAFDMVMGKQAQPTVPKLAPAGKKKKKSAKRPAPVRTPVSIEQYRTAAEYPDGSVRLPEEVSAELGVDRVTANMMHQELFPGYLFRVDRYVRP